MATRSDIFTKAIREFGVTFNPDVAGYILPDGTLLDFGGGSAYDRGLDHRAIASVIRVGDGRWDSVFAFMSKGAIRLSTSSQGTWIFLDFAKGVLPTRQQLAVIGEIFRRAQECVVNVTDKNGQVLRETELLGHLTVAAVNQFLEEANEQLGPKRSKRQPAGAWKGKAELVRRMAYGWDSPLAVGNLCKLIANDLDVDVTVVSRRSGDIEELLTQAYNAGYTDRQGRKLVRVPGAWVFRQPGALAGLARFIGLRRQ